MTLSERHKAIVAVCTHAYRFSRISSAAARRQFEPSADVVVDGCDVFGRINYLGASLGWCAADAFHRCSRAARDAGRARNPQKRAEALHAACDAYYAGVALLGNSFRRFLVAGLQREL